MSEKIKLARYRRTPYFVRCEVGGSEKQYTWNGSRGDRVDTKDIPREVVDYLTMNTRCFDQGELVIVEDKEKIDEIKDGIADKDAYEKHIHSREEIEKILKSSLPKMKKSLDEIEIDSEKQFVIDVAQEMSDDLPTGKVKALAEWMGVEKDILFD